MSEFLPPPPAYEFSQQELDRKIVHALEESVAQPAQSPLSAEDDDGFVYNEAAFEAAFESAKRINQNQSFESPSSSSRLPPQEEGRTRTSPIILPPSVQPLRITRRAPQQPISAIPVSNFPTKERPSWLTQAELDQSSSSSQSGSGSTHSQALLSASSSGPSAGRASHSHSPIPVRVIPEDDEDGDLCAPPPPFAAVAPAPEAPSFNGGQRMTPYHGDGSNPPSPLSSPTPGRPALLDHFPDIDLPNPHLTNPHPPTHTRQSLPVPVRVNPQMSPRPSSMAYTPPPKAVQQPPMIPQLDLRSAYNRPARTQPSVAQPMQGVSAASFYNSAVSAHLPNTPTQNQLVNRPNQNRRTLNQEYFDQNQSAGQANWLPQTPPRQPYFTQQQSPYPQQPNFSNQQQPSFRMYPTGGQQGMAGVYGQQRNSIIPGQQQYSGGAQTEWNPYR